MLIELFIYKMSDKPFIQDDDVNDECNEIGTSSLVQPSAKDIEPSAKDKDPGVVSLTSQTYWELYPRMSEKQKKTMPIYVAIGKEAVICESFEFFLEAIRSPSATFIFWDDVLPN